MVEAEVMRQLLLAAPKAGMEARLSAPVAWPTDPDGDPIRRYNRALSGAVDWLIRNGGPMPTPAIADQPIARGLSKLWLVWLYADAFHEATCGDGTPEQAKQTQQSLLTSIASLSSDAAAVAALKRLLSSDGADAADSGR